MVIGAITTSGSLSLAQGAMTYAMSANAAPTGDDGRAAQDGAGAEADVAKELAASNVHLTTASMSALIQAQANLSRNAPAMIRQHTADTLGAMIWELDQAPPLSPAPMAVRQLRAVRSALLDIQA